MFTLGDRVRILTTGAKCEGEVVGLMRYDLFIKHYPNFQGWVNWDDNFPDWRGKDIAYVQYDSRQKSCTFEEYRISYIEHNKEEPPDSVLQYLYDRDVKESEYTFVSECDLKLIREACNV